MNTRVLVRWSVSAGIALASVALLSLAPAAAQEPKPPPPKPAAPAEPAAPAVSMVSTITRRLTDGVQMSADFYSLGANTPGPIVVCCHMEQSSRGEFTAIGPEFIKLGCYALAVDLRSGKECNGVKNETAAAALTKLGKEATFEQVYPDVVAAVQWAHELRPDAKVLLLGSGYSASLALVLAARQPDSVSAILAFSPSECIPGWSVGMEAHAIKTPVYVTCGNGPEEAARSRPIANAIDRKFRNQFFPLDTVPAKRGSPTLLPEDPAHKRRQWEPIIKLLIALAGPPAAAPEPLKSERAWR
jgi:dienelactone hydrolase